MRQTYGDHGAQSSEIFLLLLPIDFYRMDATFRLFMAPAVKFLLFIMKNHADQLDCFYILKIRFVKTWSNNPQVLIKCS